MNSFWMPKKQPLYAPMLSSFGGGSARGFNPGGGGGFAGFGVEFDGWTGDLIDINFNVAPIYDPSNPTYSWDGLDGFLSHELGYAYGAYPSPKSFVFSNAGSPYSGNPGFYATGTSTALHNLPTTPEGDRGTTLAYTGNGSPVLIQGSNSGGGFDVHIRNNAQIGKFSYLKSGSISITTDITSLGWDGEHLIVMPRTSSSILAYTLPNSTSDSFSGLTPTWTWPLGSASTGGGYGGAYLGKDASGYRYCITQEPNKDIYRWKLSPTSGSLSGVNIGTIPVTTHGQPHGGYSFMVDHKNRKLIQGAHNNTGHFSVWQE